MLNTYLDIQKLVNIKINKFKFSFKWAKTYLELPDYLIPHRPPANQPPCTYSSATTTRPRHLTVTAYLTRKRAPKS